MTRLYLILPLLSAILYSTAALFLKGAEKRGTAVTTINLLTNGATAVAFGLVFWRPGPGPAGDQPSWPILALGLSFVLGQLFTILAFSRGDVSVATPALGTKVLLVAALAHLTGLQEVRPATWLAAGLMVVGLVLLVGRPRPAEGRRAAWGVVLSLLAAFSFAIFDVLVQHWSPRLGFGRFVPPAMLVSFLLSLPLCRLQPGRGWRVPPAARRLLGFGIGLMVAQALILIWAIGTFGDAPAMNVVYASRAVWSVLVVSLLARWLAEVESFATRGDFGRRLAGAAVMTLGVTLVCR